METTKNKHEEYVIFINKKEYKVSQTSLTGAEILALAGYTTDKYDLFLVHGEKSEQIQPNQVVKMENGLHFNAILKSAPYGV